MNLTKLQGASLLLMAALTCGLHAQTSTPPVKDDLFAGTEKFAQNASSVTQIDMDPESLGMVEGNNSPRAHRTILNVVHTYAYDKPGMYNAADVEVFRNKLNTGDWHCSVHTFEQKSGSSTDVCNKHRTDGMEEKAIISVSPKELTFIHTIRRTSTPGGTSQMLPFDSLSGGWGPEQSALAKADMAESRALMAANMAELRAETGGLGLFGLSQMPMISVDGLQDMNVKVFRLPKITVPMKLKIQSDTDSEDPSAIIQPDKK